MKSAPFCLCFEQGTIPQMSQMGMIKQESRSTSGEGGEGRVTPKPCDRCSIHLLSQPCPIPHQRMQEFGKDTVGEKGIKSSCRILIWKLKVLAYLRKLMEK